MENRTAVWITGTVISASGYPRKNAEVRGVLFAASRKIGAASSTTDYSGQYFLTIETDEDVDLSPLTSDLRVELEASSYGETIEHGKARVNVSENEEREHEIRLSAARGRAGAFAPALRAA